MILNCNLLKIINITGKLQIVINDYAKLLKFYKKLNNLI